MTSLGNPSGDAYRALIKILIEQSDSFYVVTRGELQYEPEPIELLVPYAKDIHKTKQWGQSKTKGKAATLYEFPATKEMRHLLVHLADSLFDWVAPGLPEDLTFLRDGQIIFTSIAHEGIAEWQEDIPELHNKLQHIFHTCS